MNLITTDNQNANILIEFLERKENTKKSKQIISFASDQNQILHK